VFPKSVPVNIVSPANDTFLCRLDINDAKYIVLRKT
jgi:hypothetical protein